MAVTPRPRLDFVEGGARLSVELPAPLPTLGDDFAWRRRDHEGWRLGMLEELAARLPAHARWTPADTEVVLVEALAAALDTLSDQLDRVQAEAFIETARRPVSVRRLLTLIGADPGEAVDDLWQREPARMDAARAAGPRALRRLRRIVTPADACTLMMEHPLVHQAHAWLQWNGAWQVLHVALALAGEATLRDPACGAALRRHAESLRMAGQEVRLHDPQRVPVDLDVQVLLGDAYYRSEVARAVADVLGSGAQGFFGTDRQRFGRDLHGSDVVQALMGVEGVAAVVVRRFARSGGRDRTGAGVLALGPTEIAIAGALRVACEGGLKG